MISEIPALNDKETLISIDVFSGTHVTEGGNVGEHGAYLLVVHTNQRRITIEGCHDTPPEWATMHIAWR